MMRVDRKPKLRTIELFERIADAREGRIKTYRPFDRLLGLLFCLASKIHPHSID